MSKLQQVVFGQTISFVHPPRIYQSLAMDPPSGAVKLPNGESAYWRLTRNIPELKRKRVNMRNAAAELATALIQMVKSADFLNHYGLSTPPKIDAEDKLARVFNALLSNNSNRVEYTSTTHAKKRSLVETLVIHMGNQVVVYGYRGADDQPKLDGVKCKLWLTDTSLEDQCFHCTIVSPVVDLTVTMNPDRLAEEILDKVRQNLMLFANRPHLDFIDENYKTSSPVRLAAAVKDLIDLHPPKENGKGKDKKAKPQQARLEKAPRVAAVAGKSYTVVDGDTLSAIAAEAYGNAESWYLIADANGKTVTNPDLILPGMVLTLPAASTKPYIAEPAPSAEVKVRGIETESEQLLESCKSMAEAWGISNEQQRRFYLDSVTKLAANNDPTHDWFFEKFITSEILTDEWRAANEASVAKGEHQIVHELYLARLIKLDQKRYVKIVGKPSTDSLAKTADTFEYLVGDQYRLYPVFGDRTVDAFVDANIVPPRKVTTADDTEVLTAPLRVDYRTSLFRLADKQVDAGDTLDTTILLNAVYFQIQNADGSVKEAIRVEVVNRPTAQFVCSPSGQGRMELAFHTEAIDLSDASIQSQSAGLLADITGNMSFSVRGLVDMRDTSYEIVAGPVTTNSDLVAKVIGVDIDYSKMHRLVN